MSVRKRERARENERENGWVLMRYCLYGVERSVLEPIF